MPPPSASPPRPPTRSATCRLPTKTPRSPPSGLPPPSPATRAQRSMRVIERRIGLLFAGFLLCFCLIGARAFWLQGVQGSKLASEAVSQQTEAIPLPSLRGSVLDRRGNALAASEDAATIFAVPPEVTKPALAAEKLAPVLGLDEREVLGAVTAETTYSVLAKKV